MCFLSTIFPNAPAHPPPILFDQSLTEQYFPVALFIMLYQVAPMFLVCG